MNWKFCVLVLVLVLVAVVFGFGGCGMDMSDCACDAVQTDNSCVPDVLAKDVECQVKNCDDGDLCTNDSCVGNKCQHELQQCGPGAHCLDDGGMPTCVPDDLCDDGDACTVDSKATDGTCLHANIDFGPGYYCDSSKGKPFARPVPAECVDNNVCTDDHFNKSTGLCWWQEIQCMDIYHQHCENKNGEPVCVNNEHPCDDGNPCTKDTLDLDGICSYKFFCGPCKTAAECDDDNSCTVNTCKEGGCDFTYIGEHEWCEIDGKSGLCLDGYCQLQ